MQVANRKTSFDKGLSISFSKKQLRRQRADARSSAPKIGVSRFPTIDLSFFNERQLVLEDQTDLKALKILKSIVPTDETIPDKQLNDIISSIKQTDYYEVKRGLLEDGTVAILLPVCYKTFDYGLGIPIWKQFDKANGNAVDTKALFAFCKLVSHQLGYTFEDYQGSDMRREMFEEQLMDDGLSDEEVTSINEELKAMDIVDEWEKLVNKTKLPVRKTTYEKWINASSFNKKIKKSFIEAWDIHWCVEQYGTHDAYQNGYYLPYYSTVIFPNEELYRTINHEQNMYQSEGVCDYVWEWIITCEEDLAKVNYEDKPLQQFFKWYDHLTMIL